MLYDLLIWADESEFTRLTINDSWNLLHYKVLCSNIAKQINEYRYFQGGGIHDTDILDVTTNNYSTIYLILVFLVFFLSYAVL